MRCARFIICFLFFYRRSNIEIYNELHKVFLMLLTAEHFFFVSLRGVLPQYSSNALKSRKKNNIKRDEFHGLPAVIFVFFFLILFFWQTRNKKKQKLIRMIADC